MTVNVFKALREVAKVDIKSPTNHAVVDFLVGEVEGNLVVTSADGTEYVLSQEDGYVTLSEVNPAPPEEFEDENDRYYRSYPSVVDLFNSYGSPMAW